MLYKNVAGQKIHVYAYDSTTNAAKTGDAANITAYISLDGTANAIDDTNPTEVDATNMPGVYVFDLTQAETNCNSFAVYAKSTTSNIKIEPIIGLTTGAGTLDVNAAKAGGQTITAAGGITMGAYVGQDAAILAVDASGFVGLADDVITAAVFDGSTAFPQTGDAFARLGVPAGASVSDDIAAVPTAAENAAAVRDVDNQTPAANSLGAGVAAAGSAGDPWSTSLPGAYGAGTAGKILATIGTCLSGITSMASWLRGLFRKSTMDATAKSEVNTGGGTFDEASDSVEALRERGDAAWTTATGFSTLTAQQVWEYTTRTLTAFGFSVTVGTNNDKTGYTLNVTPPTADDIKSAIEANPSTLYTLLSRIIGTLETGSHNPQSGDAYARLGAPVGLTTSADIAAVKSQTAAIETDTQDLQTQVGTAGAGLTGLPKRPMSLSSADVTGNLPVEVRWVTLPTTLVVSRATGTNDGYEGTYALTDTGGLWYEWQNDGEPIGRIYYSNGLWTISDGGTASYTSTSSQGILGVYTAAGTGNGTLTVAAGSGLMKLPFPFPRVEGAFVGPPSAASVGTAVLAAAEADSDGIKAAASVSMTEENIQDIADGIIAAGVTGGFTEEDRTLLGDIRDTVVAPSADAWTVRVTKSGLPVEGVEVWITTDAAGANVVRGVKRTDEFGEVDFPLDPGNYYLWRVKAGYEIPSPTAIVVS